MQSGSARVTFATRSLLAPRTVTGANQAVAWPRFITLLGDAGGGGLRDALYALEELKGAQRRTYTDDWRSLTAPLLYLVVFLRWKSTFEASLPLVAQSGQPTLEGLSAWLLPAVFAESKKSAHGDDAGAASSVPVLDASAVALTSDGAGVPLVLVHVRAVTEELALALYATGSSLTQAMVVLSNRLGEPAVLKCCLKLANVAAWIWSSLAAFRRIFAQAAAVEAQGDVQCFTSGRSDLRLDRMMPYNVDVLAACFSQTCAQAAEMWVQFYMGKLESAEDDGSRDRMLSKLVRMCYRCALDYAAVYDALLLASGKNETQADQMEICAAGHETHGRMRRTAAVKRYYYIALACSYLLDAAADSVAAAAADADGMAPALKSIVPHTSEAVARCRQAMKESLNKMRQSLAKNKQAWETARYQEFYDSYTGLTHHLESATEAGLDAPSPPHLTAFDSFGGEASTSEPPKGFLDSLFGDAETLPGIDTASSGGEPIEPQPDLLQLAEAVCTESILNRSLFDSLQAALPVGSRRVIADLIPRMDELLAQLGGPQLLHPSSPTLIDLPTVIRSAPSSPLPPFPSTAQEAPADVRECFASNPHVFQAFRRLALLASALQRIGVAVSTCRDTTRRQELAQLHAGLLEQFTTLVTLSRTIFFLPQATDIDALLVLEFARALVGSDWQAIRDSHMQRLALALIPSSLTMQHMDRLAQSQRRVKEEIERLHATVVPRST